MACGDVLVGSSPYLCFTLLFSTCFPACVSRSCPEKISLVYDGGNPSLVTHTTHSLRTFWPSFCGGEKKSADGASTLKLEANINTGQPQTVVLFCVSMVSLYAKRNPTTCILTIAADNMCTDRQQPSSHATVA